MSWSPSHRHSTCTVTSLRSFPPASQPASQPSQPSKLDTVVLYRMSPEPLEPRMSQQMQVYLVLYDASTMGLDPYSGKTWP